MGDGNGPGPKELCFVCFGFAYYLAHSVIHKLLEILLILSNLACFDT